MSINIRQHSGQIVLSIASATPDDRFELWRLKQTDSRHGGGDAIKADGATDAEFADLFAAVIGARQNRGCGRKEDGCLGETESGGS